MSAIAPRSVCSPIPGSELFLFVCSNSQSDHSPFSRREVNPLVLRLIGNCTHVAPGKVRQVAEKSTYDMLKWCLGKVMLFRRYETF